MDTFLADDKPLSEDSIENFAESMGSLIKPDSKVEVSEELRSKTVGLVSKIII